MRYNYIKIAYLKLYVFINVLLFFCSAIPVLADNFIKTVLVYYVTSINVTDIPKLAKYDVLVLNRFNYDDFNGMTWNLIKEKNANIKIFLYQLGPETSDRQDDYQTVYLNSISRIENSRNHTMGVLSDSFFLKDSAGKRINNSAYPTCWLLDFGNPAFQKYWAEATQKDIVDKPWRGDGILIDNCVCAKGLFNNNPFGGKIPVKYINPSSWNLSMNNFIVYETNFLHKNNMLVFVNRGNSRDEAGYGAWLDLDNSSAPPDIIMEEGAFAVRWSPNDVQFYSEKEWKRQIDLGYQIKNSRIAYLSHTDLKPNGIGVDNFGKQVTYWQILWYSMCSYHLAKDQKNMPFFMFVNNPYKQIAWFTEYDKIDLGMPKGGYEVINLSAEANIYWREFEKGYVYVNPSLKDSPNINLPVPCVQLTHENIDSPPQSLPVTQKINIPSHHGVIVMKASTLSLSITTPRNVRFSD